MRISGERLNSEEPAVTYTPVNNMQHLFSTPAGTEDDHGFIPNAATDGAPEAAAGVSVAQLVQEASRAITHACRGTESAADSPPHL